MTQLRTQSTPCRRWVTHRRQSLLNVTTESLENCEVLMTVEVDEKQKEKLLKAAAQRISRQVRIPGFRPGKAPYQMVIRRVGEEAVRNEAMEDLGQSVFKQALEQADLEPYAQASLEDVSWEPLVMKVRVPVAPVVELGDYRALRLEQEPVQVTGEEIDQALESLREQHAVWNPVERPARRGDRLAMAVQERAGDEILVENDNVDYELEAEDSSRQPDLTTPLIGLSAGEKKEFTVTYPETVDDPRYAGKQVTISVTVHSVKQKELYPLDDEFAQTVGDFDTLDQLKEKLAENIRKEKERQADRELGEKALETLIGNAGRIAWPQVLEEQELDRALEEQDRRLQQSHLSLDTYLSMQKQTREEFREEFRPAVQQRLRRSLVLGKLADLEGVSVTGHEITGQIDRLSSLAGERREEIREALATPQNVERIISDLVAAKVMDRLVHIVKGEAGAGAEEEAETEAPARVEEIPDTESIVTG